MTEKPKVIVVGAGWAGLGATYQLTKQGYDVTLLDAGSQAGGLVAGWKTEQGRSVEAGIHGFWYPYRNIFSLVKELELDPFTPWTRSAQYSPAGLEVESPIFQDLPRLPSPLGTFAYTQFKRLPLSDRLSALPLMYAVVDFDNSDDAWKRYDGITARELFRQYGVSERLYRESFEPMLLVGLFAPGEQCSAAAALGMLYYFILAHQADFDVVWCRGTVGEKIFKPWCDRIKDLGGKILTERRVSDVQIDNSGKVTGVICGDESFEADAVIFSVGISGMQKIVSSSPALQKRREFRNLMNLGAIDVLAVRLWFDRKIKIPRPSNACFGFDVTTGWTFFDLNALHDEYGDETGSVIEVDFYHANQFLPLDNQEIVAIVQKYLISCLPEFETAKVIDSSVIRLPRAVTHFAPGSYQHLLRAITSFPNLYMSGDWVITNHGSWSQEKAYVTGLEAANLVIQQFSHGNMTQILPIESDEPHIQIARSLNQTLRNIAKSLIPNFLLP
ncbi:MULTISPECIES: hydroxysqualene dehydroxylase [Pseudanabaena]|uniref:hydroxysqualene dehydroxylase n=1 Tax=Pseudanabaena TaxID=1152 RepID=UPI002478A660|nr:MULTISPECIES: FAD-dependent oxidoreductase [Pseudanabaena]MEA5487396.1 FAD-dependent oxidoreductase [Pseudanabaena sp. CCNP1317]WGS73169.1 FAD-dependent oxidoreductase [Pseudanabaena galeata CCNP1313]